MKMFKISLCFFCFTWIGCSSHDCGNLTDPVNGVVTYSSGTTFQSNATFTCDTGYSLDGNPTRTCQANSTWSDSDPTCAINKCGNLSNPINGFVTYTNGTNYQSIAKFSCATRYSVVGDPTRTCHANKTWSGSDPVCEINGEELSEGTPDRTTVCAGTPLRGSCPSGTVIAVKYIQYGTKATCAPANCCDYDINDCLIDCTDTAQQAACSGREVCNDITIGQADMSSCGPPYPVPGLNNYLTMVYYCIPESRISSIVSSSLSQTGNLLYLQNTDYPNSIRTTSMNVSCSVEVSSCSSQIGVYFLHFELSDGATCTDNQNLKIVDNGSTQTYTCSDNTGYEIALMTTSSSNYITAVLENPAGTTEGKIWLGFEATDSTAHLQIDCPAKTQINCKDCHLLVSPTDGSISFSDNTAYQSVATFSCNTGYSLVGSSTRQCQMNGSWSNVNPSCIVNDCGSLSDPFNGIVTYSSGTTYQSIATFVCNTGFSLVGYRTRTCQANKTWSDFDPFCYINDCGNLTVPVNGAVEYSSGTNFQSTAKFSCDTGYSLDGDSTRTCQANSTWSDSDPTCLINTCGSLTNPANGAVTYSNGTSYQSTATFGCNIGYSLVGDETITCQANQTWNASNPLCKINDCGNLTGPDNGGVIYSSGTTYQSTATFSCDTGYSLVGNATRTCKANSIWSDNDPSCAINKCGNLTSPANGFVTYTKGTNYQSIATFSCATGYSVVGDPTRTCQANKTWRDNNPICGINDCGSLKNPLDGSVTYSSGTTFQSVATFNCETGFLLHGVSTRICQANKLWSDTDPTCVMSVSRIIGICIGSSAAITFLMLLLYLLFKYLLLRRCSKNWKTPIKKADPEDRCIFHSTAESYAAKESNTEELHLDDYLHPSPGLKQPGKVQLRQKLKTCEDQLLLELIYSLDSPTEALTLVEDFSGILKARNFEFGIEYNNDLLYHVRVNGEDVLDKEIEEAKQSLRKIEVQLEREGEKRMQFKREKLQKLRQNISEKQQVLQSAKVAEPHDPITAEAEFVASYTDLKPPEERDDQDYTTINP